MADELNEFEEFNDLDEQQQESPSSSDNDVISSLLEQKGISDPSSIKIANEQGDVEEHSWDELSHQAKMDILHSPSYNPERDLDEDEIALINEMRKNNMTPAEYLRYVQNQTSAAVQSQLQNRQQFPVYQIDQYTDDELYVADLMSRMDNITEDELVEALANAKSNPTLYRKQIDALRQEYQEIEDENSAIAQQDAIDKAKEQFAQYSQQLAYQIDGLRDFAGYDLNLEANDKQKLFEFMTGFDPAGQNYFSKALADPAMAVKAAYFILNGEQMISDITDYFTREITNMRRYYEQGRNGRNGRSNGNTVVFANKNKSSKQVNDDIDFV